MDRSELPDDDGPFDRHLDALGQFLLGPPRTGGELALVEEIEGRDVTAADPLECRVAVELRPLREAHDPGAREAGRRQLGREGVRLGEAGPVDRLKRGKEPVQPEAIEMRRVEGRDHRAAAGCEYAGQLGQRARPVDEVDDEAQHRPFEPGAAERQLLRPPQLHADGAWNAASCDLEHLGLGIYRPHTRRGALGERCCDHPRAAADVEHAPPTQVTLADEQLEDLPPQLVRRTELVVARGARAEVGSSLYGSAMMSSGSLSASMAS